MVIRNNKIITELKNLIKTIEKNGISISTAYLFGSYAKGKANQWSDIDVALVSNDFGDVRFYNVLRLLSILKKYDNNIEFHPFLNKDFDAEHDLFVKEIQEQGIRIK
jgi:predicted nucleotidyltransferase